jgi:hypothetical protein
MILTERANDLQNHEDNRVIKPFSNTGGWSTFSMSIVRSSGEIDERLKDKGVYVSGKGEDL